MKTESLLENTTGESINRVTFGTTHGRSRALSVILVLALLGCDDGSSGGSSSDSGTDAAVSGPADEGADDDVGSDEAEEDDAPDDSEPGTDDDTDDDSGSDDDSTQDCTLQPSTSCDGANVVVFDPCDDTTEVVETCESECYQGRCEDCVPTSGVICDGGDVHQLDSCGVVGARLQECANGCSNGACIAEDCSPRAALECEDDLLWEVDSCDNRTNVADVCEDGCMEGSCVGCEQLGDAICYEGNIHSIDSCGVVGAMVTDCEGTCSSVSGDQQTDATCIDDTESCMATGGITCLGDLRAVDSCGNVLAEVVEDCPNGCNDMGCLPCSPRPIGLQCVGGNVHRTIGGCDDPAIPEATALTTCEFGCSAGECTEDECVPNAGSICSDGDLYSTDSCGALGALIQDCPAGCNGAACTVVATDGGVEDSGSQEPEAGPEAGSNEPAEAGPVIDSGTTDEAGADAGGMDGG